MKIEGLDSERTASLWDAYENYRRSLMEKQGSSSGVDLSPGGTQESEQTKRVNDTGQCQTCKERKYQDGSDDPGVSYKTPTRISSDQAAAAVRGHEMEHVNRERAKAVQEDRKVVSQSVTYHSAICPECGKVYVSGGTTRTVTRGKPEPESSNTQPEGFEAYA